jgi:tellurite resistance protein
MAETDAIEPTIDPQAALVYLMVMVSAADAEMTDDELRTMGELVRFMKVFQGFEEARMPELAQECSAMMQDPDGLEYALALLRASLPVRLRETAYAIACDIAAADGYATQEELRLLELLRHRLEIDRLIAAAIERGARARHMTL